MDENLSLPSRSNDGQGGTLAIPGDWLLPLNAETRRKAEELIRTLRDLGDPRPELGAFSEITENIPQLARFLVLRHLWTRAINRYRTNTAWIPMRIEQAENDPTDSFADSGLALRRMLDAGITLDDIGSVARMIAYEAVFNVLEIIDEGYDSDIEKPGWALMELDETGEPTGRHVAALHEDILIMDSSGVEGEPEQQ